MAIQLIGGGVTVGFEASPWGILEGGISLKPPAMRYLDGPDSMAQPGRAHVGAKYENRVVQLKLRLSGANVDALQTEVRKVEKILNLASLQQSGRRGYPFDFQSPLNCYLNYAPANLSAGGYFRIVRGSFEIHDNFYSGHFWRNKYLLATLTLECWPHLRATAETEGTKAATAHTSMPIAIASGDAGGNDAVDIAPIRLGIQNPAATVYQKLYCAIYPALGTYITPILNTAGAGNDVTLLDSDYYSASITNTTPTQVGSISVTVSGTPRRYLVIIKRRTSAVTNLNWRLQTTAGNVVSSVWEDDATPNNAWGAFVAGIWEYPPRDGGAPTDADGLPVTVAVSLNLMAYKQAAGDASATVDTDFIAVIPMDGGVYFCAKPVTPAAWVTADKGWLNILNDDGVARFNLGDNPPGAAIAGTYPTGITFDGALPLLWPGDNRVVLIGVRNDGTIMHSDTFALQWTFFKRYISL